MKKILVVEDDRNIVMSLGIRLEAAGYEVKQAHDCASGFNIALEFEPDLLLLDVLFPGGGGFGLASRLKDHPVLGGRPIIFLTASQQPGLCEDAKALGAVDFMCKPYEARTLLASIDNALDDVEEEKGAFL